MFKGEVQIFRPISFKELGLDKEKGEGIYLKDAQVVLAKVAFLDSDRAYYLLAPQHPFSGKRLSAMLSSTSPLRQGNDLVGIRADFNLPEHVRNRSATSQQQTLHNRHTESPIIGPDFVDFISNHVPRWMNALRSFTYESAKGTAHSILNIVDRDKAASEVLQQKIEKLNLMSTQDKYIDTGELAIFGRALLMQGDNTFVNYLTKNVELGDTKADKYYWNLPAKGKIELLRNYLQKVGKSTRLSFGFNYLLDEKDILIDWGKKKYWKTRSVAWPWEGYSNVRISFLGPTTGLIKTNDFEIPFSVVEAKNKKDGSTSFYIKSVKLPDVPESLYGLWAYEKDFQGSRRFLSQQEALQLLPDGFPNKNSLDVYLGRVQMAYFSPQITGNWPDRMPLVPGGPLQYIMGAQTPIWVSVNTENYPHASQLLSNNNPLVGTIESVWN